MKDFSNYYFTELDEIIDIKIWIRNEKKWKKPNKFKQKINKTLPFSKIKIKLDDAVNRLQKFINL